MIWLTSKEEPDKIKDIRNLFILGKGNMIKDQVIQVVISPFEKQELL